ncbi:farnesol dehydrogenase [Mycetomoellerius zeteki]|uniref:farnesol dehydrogenase n=1 Tax=Mycetomoellerius zeteki TaxID=64791 RepID=UPI00084EBBDC|nr:PREDICTED: farnesol dehydrogenase-like [Trachymyrmex zeteki]XP_018316997.1 PREDICTED: farnesol dehydrogenase-like [Trachymyrmex zeteki]
MDRWLGKTAVVTGAGSGIGEAITHALLQNGINVVALEVQKGRLAKLDAECKREGFAGKLYTICCDITHEDEIDAAFSHIETLGGVDIMVNNAGVVASSRVIESDRKTFERLLNINVLAVAVCTNKAVRLILKRNVEGHIFNINSVLSHYLPLDGMPDFNLYPATKHASLALTDTVRGEIAKIKAPIRITGISPGIVSTNIVMDARNDFFEKVPSLQPKDIADALIYALGTRPEVQITQITIQHTRELP